MDKSQAGTRIVLAVILKNYREALNRNPDNFTSITEQTIDAIQDNAHNIHHRSSDAQEATTPVTDLGLDGSEAKEKA